VCACIYVYVCAQEYVCIYVCIYMCMYMGICLCVCMCVYVCMNVSVCICMYIHTCMYIFSSVQLLSRVRLSATPWIAARQASLSITNSWSLPKLMYILGWNKSNCSLALLNFSVWYWNIFLNKCGYVIHHFNVHFLLYVFFSLMTYYFLFFNIYFRPGNSC